MRRQGKRGLYSGQRIRMDPRSHGYGISNSSHPFCTKCLKHGCMNMIEMDSFPLRGAKSLAKNVRQLEKKGSKWSRKIDMT